MARTEDKLIALASGSRADASSPAKIGAAADRILRDSGVARCFYHPYREGSFSWDYDQEALHYEEDLLAGRYVITTSLGLEQASTADIVRHYRAAERRTALPGPEGLPRAPTRVPLDRGRVRGHVALCVLAATIEAVMGKDLATRPSTIPTSTAHLSPRRALAELDRIRRVNFDAGARTVSLVTRRNALQSQILAAFKVDSSGWDRAAIA